MLSQKLIIVIIKSKKKLLYQTTAFWFCVWLECNSKSSPL